jgi:hypothetical protein
MNAASYTGVPVDYELIREIVRAELERTSSSRIAVLEAELRFVIEHGVNQSRILKVLEGG